MDEKHYIMAGTSGQVKLTDRVKLCNALDLENLAAMGETQLAAKTWWRLPTVGLGRPEDSE